MKHLSIWDQKNRRAIKRGFKAAKIVVEFRRTKIRKIVQHTLAEINFNANPQINKLRDEVINRDIGKLTTSGFRYENIGNVYSPNGELLKANTSGEYTILAHGAPMSGDSSGGKENCFAEGMDCASGQGTNKECNPGKCKIGKLVKVSNYKWKYTSLATYGSDSTPAEYYIGGRQVLELKAIVRGKHINPDKTELGIDTPASKGTTIYVPPVNYLGDLFSKDYLEVDQGGIITQEEDFIRLIIERGYKKKFGQSLGRGGIYTSLADSPLSEEIYASILDFFYKLPSQWKKVVDDLATRKWEERGSTHETNRQFITFVFRDLKEKFSQALQITGSSWKESKIRYISDELTRPTYLRLPGTSLTYRVNEEDDVVVVAEEKDRFEVNISALEIGTIVTTSDRKIAYQFLPRVIEDRDERERLDMSPVLDNRTKEELYSPRDPKSWRRLLKSQLPKAPVAKWLLAGVDEFLREKKHDIDSFYFRYLDPTECSVKNLDWLAQHVGLSSPVWNPNWDEKYKRALIKNALGWFDDSLTTTIGSKTYKTIKGEVTNEFPFNSSTWRDAAAIETGEFTDVSEIDISKISSISYDSTTKAISDLTKFVKKDGTEVEGFSVNKEEWQGLMKSKGSLISLVFLFSLFGVKAHSSNELLLQNEQAGGGNLIKGTLKVKSGLRAYEAEASTLLPFKQELAQVGTQDEYNAEVYSNQLVADRTSIADYEGSRDIIFRLPFYYNRNGRTWDIVEMISKYWVSGALNPHVQYAYLAADLWRQGDAFFEPEIIDESIDIESRITTESGNNYITSENSIPILYN